MKSWSWILLIVLTILIKWASWYPEWVETYYSQGLYPIMAKVQRFLLGWIPISVGDLFYAFLVLVIVFKTGRFFKLLFQWRLNRSYFKVALQQAIFFVLFVYVFFNLLWGLNYNRQGIAKQLQLDVKQYSLADLDTLTRVMQNRVNEFATYVNEAQRDSFDKKKLLFSGAVKAYKNVADKYSFLSYPPRSIKPSIFSYLGNYLGFQGYYNPFSGEGQVNTTIPRFLEPFVSTHEMAHQLGYARENEANFVGYLACRHYNSPVFQYSVYYEMYSYAWSELAIRNLDTAIKISGNEHPQIKKDRKEYQQFYRKYHNLMQPVIMWGYGHFLKANNQPSGTNSYNEVVAWLVAYYKKYGIAQL